MAVADALGTFGEPGALACHWSTSRGEAYTSAAYRLYLNYDGKGSRYGDQAVSASEDDKQALSVHAATYTSAPGRLSVLVIHNLYPAFMVCDRFVVMNHGRKVFEALKEETSIEELTKHVVLT